MPAFSVEKTINQLSLSASDRHLVTKMMGQLTDAIQTNAAAIDALTAHIDTDHANVTGATTDYASTVGDISAAVDALITN